MSNKKLKQYMQNYNSAKQEIMRDNFWSSDQFDRKLEQYRSLTAEYKELQKIKSRLRADKLMRLGKINLDLGSVVKLHYEEDMCEKYDPQLKKLVDGNHRFVIGIHFGLKSNCVPLHLLSTSELANKDYKNGCKLMGKYTEFDKDVYIDLNTIWFVKKNCIQSYEYHLENIDLLTLGRIFADKNLTKVECKMGITSSNIFKNEFEDYKKMTKFCNFNNDERMGLFKQAHNQVIRETFGSYHKCVNILELYGMPGHTNTYEYNIAKLLLERTQNEPDICKKNEIINRELDILIESLPKEFIDMQEINLQRGYDYFDVNNFKKFMDEDYIKNHLNTLHDTEWEELTSNIIDIVGTQAAENGLSPEEVNSVVESARKDLAKRQDSQIIKNYMKSQEQGKKGFWFTYG